MKFRSHVLGGKLIIRTDHKALTFLKTCKLVSERLTRWIMAIQDCWFEMQHCGGKSNIVADTLSRMPSHESGYPFDLDEGKIFLYTLAKRPLSELQKRFQNFIQEQKQDLILQKKYEEIKEE